MDVTLGIKLYNSFSLGGRGVLREEKPWESTSKGKRGASKGENPKGERRNTIGETGCSRGGVNFKIALQNYGNSQFRRKKQIYEQFFFMILDWRSSSLANWHCKFWHLFLKSVFSQYTRKMLPMITAIFHSSVKHNFKNKFFYDSSDWRSSSLANDH